MNYFIHPGNLLVNSNCVLKICKYRMSRGVLSYSFRMLKFLSTWNLMEILYFLSLRWFWSGASWRARSDEAHDTGSGDAILSCTGNSYGCATLLGRGGCVVCRMYIRRVARSSHSISSTKSCSTSMYYIDAFSI